MDAVEFIYKARRRYNMTGKVCSVLFECYTPESIVKELEEWCKEHPAKTRQSEFLKEWPDTYLDGYGVVSIAPCMISKDHQDMNCDTSDCADCRKAFWSQEVE